MQKTAYEMRICDWSSDVCSSDLFLPRRPQRLGRIAGLALGRVGRLGFFVAFLHGSSLGQRSQSSRTMLAESFLIAGAQVKTPSPSRLRQERPAGGPYWPGGPYWSSSHLRMKLRAMSRQPMLVVTPWFDTPVTKKPPSLHSSTRPLRSDSVLRSK